MLQIARFARREKHTGTLPRCVGLPVEGDDALFRRLDDVDKVVVGACVDVELATFQHRSLVDGQRLRTTKTFATDRPFQPDGTGLASVVFQLMIETSLIVGMRIPPAGPVTIQHLKKIAPPLRYCTCALLVCPAPLREMRLVSFEAHP